MFCYTDVSRAPLFRAACSRSLISSQHLGNDQPMFYRDIMSSSLSSYTPHNHHYAGPHCNLVVNTVSCQFMLPPPPKMFMYIGLFRFFSLFRYWVYLLLIGIVIFLRILFVVGYLVFPPVFGCLPLKDLYCEDGDVYLHN